MELHNKGASYCAINTAKSALFSTISVINHPEWHKHEAVCKFMKGIWKSAPPTPKYTKTWNVDKVIRYIKTHLANNVSLSLKQLTIKSVFLVAITSGQRGQAIHLMHLDNLTKCENKLVFNFPGVMKDSKIGKHNTQLIINRNPDTEVCPFSAMECYLQQTENLRKSNEVWISVKKPHKSVTRQSISRYIKEMLVLAGIPDYGPHSTRMASTSKAHKSVGLSTILKTASWSSQENFIKYYCRETEEEEPSALFAEAVLSV